MTEDLVVMLTALNVEYEAVRRRLTNLRTRRHPRGTRFEVGAISGTRCRVALGLTGKGNGPAAVLSERAIQEFAPAAVLFVGIAGALREGMPLGDVVMATQIYAYHGGTSDDEGLKARPRSWEVSHGISQLAAQVGRSDAWAGTVPPGARVPRVHFGPIAAGEIVQNSRISHEARWIREHYNDALAIEMESAGVAQACHLNGAAVAVIRGISDLADGTKSTSGDGTWQPRAADNAAAFAVRLAEELITDKEHGVMHGDRPVHRAETDTGIDTGTVTNVAIGGQVGIQAGNVSGSTVVSFGVAPQDSTSAVLAAELAAFREQLARVHAAGRIDSATYEAAQTELDLADKALERDTSENRNAFVLALKRLRGLTADVTDLATRIVALLAIAKGLG